MAQEAYLEKGFFEDISRRPAQALFNKHYSWLEHYSDKLRGSTKGEKGRKKIAWL